MTEKEFRDLWNRVVASSNSTYEDDAVETARQAGLVFDPGPPATKDPCPALSEGARLQRERDAMIQRQFYQKLLVETARELYAHVGGPERCVIRAETLLRLCGLERPGRTAQEPES